MSRIYQLEIVESDTVYTLQELCRRKNLESEFIIQCVDHGIAEVRGAREEDWLFPAAIVPRLEKAFRLRRDLGLDFTGLAVVIDLLEEIDELRARVGTLHERLQVWENGR